MPDLPQHKAGIVACSGEELAEGTVTRLAALKVLQSLRPDDTVTICLPLFLAGGAGDRAFARFHPTITVDGCELRCAARATERYSAKPAASIVVNDLVAELGLPRPEGRRHLNEAGRQAVDVIARRLATLVDEVLGRPQRAARGGERVDDEDATAQPEVEATCSCGSGVPVKVLTIDGAVVEIVALPLIYRQLRDAGRGPGESAGHELLEAVKIYNTVPPEAEASYREALLRDYAAFCQQETAG
jgi:uncharacterized metal-binding protein